MIPIILAGGSGTRFWPLSRREEPKQLLSLFGDDRSMIATTVERLRHLCDDAQHIQIVCRPELVAPTKAVLTETPDVEFIVEPSARDTAPAIALATAVAESRYGDAPVAFFPADHFIGGQVAFEECLRFAEERARKTEGIITLGIPPTRPETGYGYIECNRPVADQGKALFAEPVEAFVEKPNKNKALQYLNEGRYLWNAGIFVFRPSTLWKELHRQHPDFAAQVDVIRDVLKEDDPDQAEITRAFEALESISIDYAVMEGARQVEVIPALFRWSDVGHWAALDEVLSNDEDGNVVEADVLLDNVRNCVLFSQGTNRLIAASNLENLVIVDTPDALLVVPRAKAQHVKELVQKLQQDARKDLL